MTTNILNNEKIWSSAHLVLFLVGIVILCFPIFSFDYLITLDGPNHLYSSKIFYSLLQNDDFYRTYFDLNSNFTPNYFTVLILGGLQSIFSGVVALKAFHLLHVLLLVFGALFWNNSCANSKLKYPYLVFPFVYSYLFFSGFYNFIFAVSLSLFVIGFYNRFANLKWKAKHYIIVGSLLILVYCSHIIPFFFAGLFIFIDTIIQWKKRNWEKAFLKHALLLLASCLPGLLLTLLFMGSRESTTSYLEFNELVARLSSGFSIVIKPSEMTASESIDYLKLIFLIIALMLFLYQSFTSDKKKSLTLPLTAVMCLLLYFTLPDSVGYASVFSVRIEYIFWLFIAIGATQYRFENKFIQFIPAIAGLGLLIFQINSNLPYWETLNSHAKSVENAAEVIEENTVVYPIFNSLLWDDYHMSNILGAHKDVMILENTSARQDYFPLIYKAPYEDCIKEIQSDQFSCLNQSIKVNYLLVIGKEIVLEDPLGIALYAKAFNEGEVVYEDGFIQLLKFPD